MDRVFDKFFRFTAFPFGRRAFELEPFQPFEGIFRPSFPTSLSTTKSTLLAPNSSVFSVSFSAMISFLTSGTHK